MNSIHKPLKVFHVISRLNVGGAPLYVLLLVSHLKKQGIDARLVHGKVGGNEGDMLKFLPEGKVDFPLVEIPELGRNIYLWRDVIAFWKLLVLFWRERPDVVHTHTAKAGCLGTVAAWLTGVPVRIQHVHSNLLRGGFFTPAATRLLRVVSRWLARRSQLLLACSTLVQKEYLEERIAPPEKIHFLPYGLELDQFKDLSAYRGKLRAHLNLPDDVPLVGMVARLVPIKAVDVFLNAIREVVEKFPKVHFAITGNGELKDELIRQAQDLGIAGHVSFVGFWQEMREIYADYDLLVLSSHYEGLGLVIVEAMAAGKTAVGTNVGGIPDVIHHGEDGLLFEDGDAHGLAEAMLSLLTDPEKTRKLAATGQARVFQEFTIERSAELTAQVYRRLLPVTGERGRHSLLQKQEPV